jgi:hypothetical protein
MILVCRESIAKPFSLSPLTPPEKRRFDSSGATSGPGSLRGEVWGVPPVAIPHNSGGLNLTESFVVFRFRIRTVVSRSLILRHFGSGMRWADTDERYGIEDYL